MRFHLNLDRFVFGHRFGSSSGSCAASARRRDQRGLAQADQRGPLAQMDELPFGSIGLLRT